MSPVFHNGLFRWTLRGCPYGLLAVCGLALWILAIGGM